MNRHEMCVCLERNGWRQALLNGQWIIKFEGFFKFQPAGEFPLLIACCVDIARGLYARSLRFRGKGRRPRSRYE